MGTRTEHYATSRDGTRVGYVQQGTGPGLVLVQGAMADASAYAELAEAMATTHTVYSADRRGRGLSPRAYDPGHDIARDVEDLDAILAATGAERVFGLSSGAVITLEAARTLRRVRAAAVFEPPLGGNRIPRKAGIERIKSEIAHGDLGAALIDSLLTAGTAPRLLRILPRFAQLPLGRIILEIDGRRRRSSVTLRDLLPAIRYDFDVVTAMAAKIDLLVGVAKPVLLLGGTKSPAHLRRGVRALEQILPDARRVELAGLGHDGPWNKRRGGRPQKVAAALISFFAEVPGRSPYSVG